MALLHKCFIGICFRKGTHILKVTRRKAPHFRERDAQVAAEALNHFCSPFLFLLTEKNISPDLPVEQDKLAVDREGRFDLSRADAPFKITQEVVIAGIRQNFCVEVCVYGDIPAFCARRSKISVIFGDVPM